FDGAVELAGEHQADRNTKLDNGLADFGGHLASLRAQLPLGRYVCKIKRIGILLALFSGAMAKNDDVAAPRQIGEEIFCVSSACGQSQDQTKQRCSPSNHSHFEIP